MKLIKTILKLFLIAQKNIPKDIIGHRYGTIFKLMSNNTFRNISIGLANKLGYKRLLPILESNNTYTDVPVEIAERAGKDLQKSYSIAIPTIAERIAKLDYNDDSLSHIKVLNSQSDFMKKMVTLCPTKCYSIENERVMLQHEGCIECGTCAKETEWKHPRGEKGIIFKYG